MKHEWVNSLPSLWISYTVQREKFKPPGYLTLTNMCRITCTWWIYLHTENLLYAIWPFSHAKSSTRILALIQKRQTIFNLALWYSYRVKWTNNGLYTINSQSRILLGGGVNRKIGNWGSFRQKKRRPIKKNTGSSFFIGLLFFDCSISAVRSNWLFKLLLCV